jgi:natural product precursor
MKTKKLNKKLTFSKNTIANLNSKDLKDIYGGAWDTNWTCTCGTCYYTCDDMTCFHYGTHCAY